MKTMASVWFSVLVFVAVQEALGSVCNKENNELSCDECIRCGGSWCTERGEIHCVFSLDDGWCPDHQEMLVELPPISNRGDQINPIYAERTLFINVPDTIEIHYSAKKKQKPKIELANTTQSFNIEIEEMTKCSQLINCITTIEAKPKADFCSSTGRTEEFIYVKVNVGGFADTILLKYHVPCACKCSQIVAKNSPQCSGHGDFSCGVCTCHNEWTGYDCSKPICENKRGDLQCTSTFNDLECSGNGYCGPCDSCVCYTDREGSQYFDHDNYCADLCMVVSDCEHCLANNTIGRCDVCTLPYLNKPNMYLQKYNSSLIEERDQLNRKVWVKCNQTVDETLINFVVKKDDDGDVIVMIVQTSNDAIAAGQIATPKIPIILAVVGILATIAAVAGVMIWKHMNALPPAPLNNPGYENIDAEDCTGENPLYKPPTSNFKNPMYGSKW